MWFAKQRAGEKGIALITALLLLLLLTSLAAGFTLLVTSEQRSNGLDLDHTKTFYAAYGAMEQLNAQVGTLFANNPQHVTAADITAAIASLPPLPGVNLVDPSNYCPAGDYTSTYNGYCVSYDKDANGNPAATTGLITQGPYQGFQGLITNYTITINAESTNYSITTDTSSTTNKFGSEIRLKRTFQTVAIPVFQFGIFSQTDLSFFPGPDFNFGGKVATNGNLYLAGGSTVVLSDKVSAYGDVIRDRLANGYSGANYQTNYPGDIYPTASPSGPFTGSPPPPVPPYRSLAYTEGSISGGPSLGCNKVTGKPNNSLATPNASWTTISMSDYNGNLRNGAFGCPWGTGAKNLTLPILSPTAVAAGASALSLIKQPPDAENPATSPIFPYRYFSYPVGANYAMLRILIADTPAEILAEPTVSQPAVALNTGYPVPLFCAPVAGGGVPCTALDTSSLPVAGYAANPPSSGAAIYVNSGTPQGYAQCLPITSASAGCPSAILNGAPNSKKLPPWAASSGTVSAKTKIGTQTAVYGDWYAQGQPRLWGYIKIEYCAPGLACATNATGAWTDVTTEILSLGTTGRNLSTQSAGKGEWLTPSGSGNPGNPYQGGATNGNGSVAAAGVTCLEPHPNAVLRFQRLRDVPSAGGCGYTNLGAAGCPIATNNAACGMSTTASDYAPLMLYDPREGLLRDTIPASLSTGWGGGYESYYLTLSGAMYYVELDVTNLARWFTGAIGRTGSPATSSGATGYLVYFSDRRGNQPCAPALNCPNTTQQKLGNLGFEDIVNPASATSTPNGSVDTGEDLNGANATQPGATPVSDPLDLYGGVPVFDCYPLNTGCLAVPLPFTNPYTAPFPMPTQVATATLTTGAGKACATPVSATNLNTPTGPNLICPSQKTSLYTTTSGVNQVYNAVPYTAVEVAEARDNAPLFFRRALKLTDAMSYNLGNCAVGVPCGLTIATENPVYVEGHFNSSSTTSFAGTEYPTSIVADAVTLLSYQWNDLNSYVHPYDLTTGGGAANPGRAGNTTYYRMAVLAGKGLSFPQPTVGVSPEDFGTDGGVHNFLRYLENWGGTLNYSGSIANFYYNVQAVGIYKCCTTVYSPPTRGYTFDTNFLTPTLLPPRTPAFTDTNTLGFTQLILPGQQ